MKYKSKPYYIDDNQLIQDFMGWKLEEGKQIKIKSFTDEPWYEDDVIDFKEWTELHHVIKKLEKLGYAMTIDPWTIEMIEYRSGNEDSLMIYQENYGDYETKLDWYYDCIVEFLKLRIKNNFIEKYEK